MNCPSCNKDVDSLKRGGLCPHCKAPLKKVRRELESGAVEYDLVFRKYRDSKDFVETDIIEEMYDIIYSHDGIKVEKSNLGNYIVSYLKRLHFNWVYCPKCETKMFWNNKISGSSEHKCKPCKTTIIYNFVP